MYLNMYRCTWEQYLHIFIILTFLPLPVYKQTSISKDYALMHQQICMCNIYTSIYLFAMS